MGEVALVPSVGVVEAEEDVFLIGRLVASELAVFGLLPLLLLPFCAMEAAARRGRDAAIDDDAGEPLLLLSAPVKKEGEEPKGLPLLVSG
jgi:hypothetical protein